MPLSAPRTITFLASVILVGLAVASLNMRLPIPRLGPFVAEHRFGMIVAGWAVLAASVLARRL